MELVIDYEFLKGSQNMVVIKEISIAAKIVLHTLHFRSLNGMSPHGSDEEALFLTTS